jgi:hypothetical protein
MSIYAASMFCKQTTFSATVESNTTSRVLECLVECHFSILFMALVAMDNKNCCPGYYDVIRLLKRDLIGPIATLLLRPHSKNGPLFPACTNLEKVKM